MKSKVVAFWVLGVSICGLSLFCAGERLDLSEVFTPGSISHRILFEMRLPRFLMALFVGGALAVLGGSYQNLFRNALAEPYLLGIASAVTLGAAIGELIFGFPSMGFGGVALSLFVAMGATSVLVVLSQTSGARDSNRLVLFGMAFNFVLASLLFLLVTYFYQGFGVGSLRWLFGQIPWVNHREVVVTYLLGFPLLLTLWVFGRSLDAMSLGDEVARTLGVAPNRTRALLLFISSALLAVTVTTTGAIGFVGLITPHATRLLFRPGSTRALFAYSFAIGATFLVVSDALARAIHPPLEFPVGVVTTLLGGPLFVALLLRRT